MKELRQGIFKLKYLESWTKWDNAPLMLVAYPPASGCRDSFRFGEFHDKLRDTKGEYINRETT
jgi:hypothetical protein